MKKIIDGAWRLQLGGANAILLEDGEELILFDAGFPGKERVVLDAIAKLGRRPSDLRHLVFTHGHPDHIGSAAAIVRETGARTWMHPLDKPFAESGGPFRPMTRSRGLFDLFAFTFMWDQNARMAPFAIDETFVDGDVLPLAGGLRVIGTPGHCAGQVAFLWGGDRLLIAGDVFMHVIGLADPIGYEDYDQMRASQRRLAGFDYHAAAFGHGPTINAGAADKVRRKVGYAKTAMETAR